MSDVTRCSSPVPLLRTSTGSARGGKQCYAAHATLPGRAVISCDAVFLPDQERYRRTTAWHARCVYYGPVDSSWPDCDVTVHVTASWRGRGRPPRRLGLVFFLARLAMTQVELESDQRSALTPQEISDLALASEQLVIQRRGGPATMSTHNIWGADASEQRDRDIIKVLDDWSRAMDGESEPRIESRLPDPGYTWRRKSGPPSMEEIDEYLQAVDQYIYREFNNWGYGRGFTHATDLCALRPEQRLALLQDLDSVME